MTYYSKRDLWLCVLMLGVVGYLTALTLIESGISFIGVVLILVFGFVVWLWFGTYYTVSEGVLYIHSGPFKSSYDINKIDSLSNTRNPISAPALSLDRLEVRGKNIYIIISPKDKEGFINALKEVNPNIIYKKN